MGKILIIDDEKPTCMLLTAMVEKMGHTAAHALNLKDGLELARSRSFDLVFLDVFLPDGIGIDILPELRDTPSKPEVIIMTAAGDPDGAETAIRNGAWDYQQKPISLNDVKLALIRVMQYRESLKKRKPRAVALKRNGIIGQSIQIQACLDIVAEAAPGDANVLITGETGTGKELFARAIHENSGRSENSLVVVDCTVLPETLVESILFGHEKGAFSGADQARSGLISQADGGTLYLDEIGELAQPVQKSFLRVLEERRFRPVGNTREISSDFRLIAATNRDLDEMVKQNRFRKDLLFRLRTVSINLPPVRSRVEDLKEITIHHLNRLCEQYGIATKGVSPEFHEAIAAYDWPGNIRELVHALENALSSARYEPMLIPRHLPMKIRVHLARKSVKNNSNEEKDKKHVTVSKFEEFPKLGDIRGQVIAELEIQYLKDLFRHVGGNIERACKISGVRRSRLYELLRKYEISPVKA